MLFIVLVPLLSGKMEPKSYFFIFVLKEFALPCVTQFEVLHHVKPEVRTFFVPEGCVTDVPIEKLIKYLG